MRDTVIKKIFKEYIEHDLNSDFNIYKNLIYNYKINDLLIGFCFEKSPVRKGGIYLSVFTQPLYIKSENIVLTFGNRLRGKEGEFWNLENNPNLEGTISELVILMKKSIDGFLDKVDTPEKFYNYYKDKCLNIRMYEAVTYSAIYSNQENIEVILENYIILLNNENLEIQWIKNLLNDALYLKSIIHDKQAIYNIFYSNICETRKAIGL